MEKIIKRLVDKLFTDMEAEKKGNYTYSFLKEQIDNAKQDKYKSIMIENSIGLSADQIHLWFPDVEVKWDNNHRIHIRWD